MPENYISKLARYVAFLYREADTWAYEVNRADMVNMFLTKIEAVRDICVMFNCRVEVWAEARKMYDFVREED